MVFSFTMLPLTVTVILSVFVLRIKAADEGCVSPKGFGFQSCDPGLAVPGVPLKQISVYNEAQCVRECLNNAECESINFRISPSFSGLSECQLHPKKVPCQSLDPVPGYVNLRQVGFSFLFFSFNFRYLSVFDLFNVELPDIWIIRR